MELEVGDFLEGTFRKWQIRSLLGKGECCTVYETVSEQDGYLNGVRAAVKIYKKEKRYAGAGMNEAQLLHMLHEDEAHDRKGESFIVNILDVFYCEGHLCLLNPSLSLSLHSIFTIHGCHGNGLPLYIVQKCCADLACGLLYLKQRGVVHADIKPSNLMWCSEKEVFQFVDFGLSFCECKQPFQKIQSLGYQSPEADQWNQNVIRTSQTKDVNMCNCSCDVWSLACVLYLLYSGQHLFQPEEQIPVICTNCQKDGMCIHGIRLRNRFNENLPANWTTHKGVSRQQHMSMLDLLTKMVTCKPGKRITPDVIESHSFLSSANSIKRPTMIDLMVLPTRVLQLANMFEEQNELNDADEYENEVLFWVNGQHNMQETFPRGFVLSLLLAKPYGK